MFIVQTLLYFGLTNRAFFLGLLVEISLAVYAELVACMVFPVTTFAHNSSLNLFQKHFWDIQEGHFTDLAVGDKFWVFKSASRTQIFVKFDPNLDFLLHLLADGERVNIFSDLTVAFLTSPSFVEVHALHNFISL
jgi:hypothetical protein